MKKLLLLFGGLMLVPLVSLTAGQSSPPILDNSSSFQVADAIKLGLSDDGLILKPKKALSGDDKLDGTDGNFEEFCSKGYYYDKVTKACKLNDVCNPNNPCSGTTPVCEPSGDGINYTCLCNNSSCGAGKTCTGGTCYNCQKGEKCGCSGNQVSDGNGGCYTPNDTCNPNPCSGETPSCSALDETQYSCSCTSTSCPAGKKCEDMTCQTCSAGEDCGCKASGKEADGNGGCRCPGMKIASGNSCVCPSCYTSDGTWGGCKKTCECVTCADAKKCVDGECVNCPLGEDCGCFDDDAYSNGNGVCEPNDPCANVTCGSDQYCEEGECVDYSCGNGGYSNAKEIGTTVPACTTLSEWEVITTGTSGGKTCYACVCKGTTFGGGGCCSGGKVTCGGKEGPCVECCNNSTNSCGSGRKCDDTKCIDCPAGEKCYCPDNQVSDGKGGCVAEGCPDNFYESNGTCKPLCSPGPVPRHWRSISCTNCDEKTGKCQGSRLDTYGTLGMDQPCLDPNSSGLGQGCETGWCLPGGTAGRSGKYVQGSHCS